MAPPTPSDLLRQAEEHIVRGEHAAAVTLYRKFVSQHRTHPKAQAVRTRAAQVCVLAGDYDAAADLIDRGGAAALGDAMMQYTLAQAHVYAGRIGPAREALERTLTLDPDHAPAIARMAVVLQHEKRWEEAMALVESALGRGVQAWDLDHAFAELAPRAGREGEAVDRVRARLGDGGLKREVRVELESVLSQLLEKRGDFAGSWAAVERANALRRRPFDADAYEAAVAAVIAAWTPESLRALGPGHETGKGLVCVMGLPRSGTTLVEQILAAHPDAEGSGEPALVEAIAKGATAESLGRLAAARRARIGADLLVKERALAGGASTVIDKQPENDRHLGFLAGVALGARAILLRRDPRDTALSCLFRNFVGGHAWSSDPVATARVIHARLALHRHWLEVLPEHAPWMGFTVAEYERVVAEPEAEARRLVGFCGLAWDDSCMRFGDRARMVPTLEPMQAARGVYRGSVARWRSFAPFMGAAMDRLHATAAEFGFAS